MRENRASPGSGAGHGGEHHRGRWYGVPDILHRKSGYRIDSSMPRNLAGSGHFSSAINARQQRWRYKYNRVWIAISAALFITAVFAIMIRWGLEG